MIIVDRPPNFEQILAAFPDADKPGVIFAFGDIYNPSGAPIPPALIAHEEVHITRQKALGPHAGSVTQWSGPELWWQKYIEDTEFRYREELLAHAAEFKAFAAEFVRDRESDAGLMMRTAMRLRAPLYNYQPPVTLQQAVRDLRREAT